jgi:hypothetical protein
MPLSRFKPLLLLAMCCSCHPGPGPVRKAAFAPLEGFLFYQPCGNPALSGNMPGGGYYLAYVLQDSLQIADCIGKVHPAGVADAVPLRSGRDFLLVLQPSGPASFSLQNMEITDSMLHIHLRPGNAGVGPYMWKIDGDGVKLIRLAADPLHYAYLPGPAWNTLAVDLRRAHWKE